MAEIEVQQDDGSAGRPAGWLARADLWTGLASLALAGAVLHIGADYPLGQGGRIGPGYGPRLLALLLGGLGLLLVLRATANKDPIERLFRPRPVLLVLASVVAFGLVFDRFGLVPAVAASVLIANWGAPENGVASAIGLAVILALFSWALFVVALKLPMPVFHL